MLWKRVYLVCPNPVKEIGMLFTIAAWVGWVLYFLFYFGTMQHHLPHFLKGLPMCPSVTLWVPYQAKELKDGVSKNALAQHVLLFSEDISLSAMLAPKSGARETVHPGQVTLIAPLLTHSSLKSGQRSKEPGNYSAAACVTFLFTSKMFWSL